MKKIIYILTLLLLVIPASNALACGNSTTDKKMSCSKSNNDHDSEKKSCCDSSDENGDNDCNGKCNDKNCHCPVSVNIPIPVNNLVVSLNPLIYVESNTWAYVQSIPKDVYLPIWQPPKIS
ncbi:MAG: hypothetical protein H6607_02190 [Flavobacteriales bacterium]|nr:hypothetical protein [Flavobacteriales bacterium]